MENLKIIKSNRKTIGIYIMPDASVEVRCPKSTSDAFIKELLNDKKEWIEKNIKEKQRVLSSKKSFGIQSGTILYFLGRPLHVRISHIHHIDSSGFYISGKDLKQSAEKLYKKYAKNIISEKVRYFSSVMNTSPLSVKINSAKTRWGSCSGKNSLNFSWKLIIADERAIDYVVVHELAHTIEHNHSKQFWKIVEAYIPDYKYRKTLLVRAQKIISEQGW